jgi:hypothetical protein
MGVRLACYGPVAPANQVKEDSYITFHLWKLAVGVFFQSTD